MGLTLNLDLVLAIWYIILKDNFKLCELEGLMQYKDAKTIECAIEWAILIDSLTLCRNILLGLATAFTCDVEAELLEIEIMSIDEIEKQKQKQSRKSTIIAVSLFCCSPLLLYLSNSSVDVNSEDQNLIASNRRYRYVSNL